MPKFWPTKENMVRDNGYNTVIISKTKPTKEWYIDHYFEGKKKLLENLKSVKSINPQSLGDDYNLSFTVKNPTEVYGIDYKKIKWFASDIMFKEYNPNIIEDMDVNKISPTFSNEISFWFVKQTKTRWVNGVPIVSFLLNIDLLATFSNVLEDLEGQFYFKKKHFNRWTPYESILFPNFKNASPIKNCSSFCKNKNNKYMTKINMEKYGSMGSWYNSEDTYKKLKFKQWGVFYYTIPKEKEVKYTTYDENECLMASSTLITYPNGEIVIPYGLVFFPLEAYIESSSNLGIGWETIISNIIKEIQNDPSSPTIQNFEVIYITKTAENQIKKNMSKLFETTGMLGYCPRIHKDHNFKKENIPSDGIKHNGGFIQHIHGSEIYISRGTDEYRDGGKYQDECSVYDLNFYGISYVDMDNIFCRTVKDILTDDINPDNEPHLTVSNHREFHITKAEKKAQILDGSILFSNGNPFLQYKENDESVEKEARGKPYLSSNWFNIFDDKESGVFGYIKNTTYDFSTSILTDRNYIDFTGASDYPFATDKYLELMNTQKNTRNSAYNNMNIEKQYGEKVRDVNLGENIANTAVDLVEGAAKTASDWWNPFQAADDVVNTAGTVAKDAIKTIADNTRDQLKIDSTYKQAKNTTDAQYADLANSASNVHNVGKVSAMSNIIKNYISNDDKGSSDYYNKMSPSWFKNDIIEKERYQIAYDCNRYGYPCDWIENKVRFTELLDRRLWNYMEIVNMKDILKNIQIDPNIIETLSACFVSGITIFRAEAIDKVLEMDFSKHNYELEFQDNEKYLDLTLQAILG